MPEMPYWYPSATPPMVDPPPMTSAAMVQA
jgi:hypothetical protein